MQTVKAVGNRTLKSLSDRAICGHCLKIKRRRDFSSKTTRRKILESSRLQIIFNSEFDISQTRGGEPDGILLFLRP